jgi:hypothetical protein
MLFTKTASILYTTLTLFTFIQAESLHHLSARSKVCTTPCDLQLSSQIKTLNKEVATLNTEIKNVVGKPGPPGPPGVAGKNGAAGPPGPAATLPSYVATAAALTSFIKDVISTDEVTLRDDLLGMKACSVTKFGKRDSTSLLEKRRVHEDQSPAEPLEKRQTSASNFLGELRLFGFNFCPTGWAAADGTLLRIPENTALFTLLTTTYGGDGRTTFAVPDLRGQSLQCALWCIALTGVFPSRG